MTQNDKINASLWSAVFMNQYFDGDSSSNWAVSYYAIKVEVCNFSSTKNNNRDLKSSLLEQDFSNFDLLTKL